MSARLAMLGVLLVGALTLAVAAPAGAALVRVSTTAAADRLLVGQSTRVTVWGEVVAEAGDSEPLPGIAIFDLEANVVDPAVLRIIAGSEQYPADLLTFGAATYSAGRLSDVVGWFPLGVSHGVGAPQELFSFAVLALAEGEAAVATGPGAPPGLLGDQPFELVDGEHPLGIPAAGQFPAGGQARIPVAPGPVVTGIPEPATLLLGGVALAGLGWRVTRRRS